MFRFKEFEIEDDRSTMKVGTDAVLLGSCVTLPEGGGRVLDIGCGCGIVGIMLAQRLKEAEIEGLDIDEASCRQAEENVGRSPWRERISISCGDVRRWDAGGMRYDLIVSNPPYFEHSLLGPSERRNGARHTEHLSFEELVAAVDRLLADEGEFWCILPCEAAEKVVAEALRRKIFCHRRTDVANKPGAVSKRRLVALKRKEAQCVVEQRYIRNKENEYSEWYRGITKDFYLWLK